MTTAFAESHATPPAETDVSPAVLARLLLEQFPDLAGLPLTPVAEGWDNAMIRIGDTLVARLPRRAVAAGLLETEHRMLPALAPLLPLPIPAHSRIGQPGCGFPWRWSLAPWLPGAQLGDRSLATGSGEMLGRFLVALHAAPADGVAPSPVRGLPLVERAAVVTPRIERLAARFEWIATFVAPTWRAAMDAPAHTRRVLLHGDLHPGNVLADEAGRLTAVIDWGDVCVGDPATDLAALWLLLPNAAERAACCNVYPVDAALIARARGWAINLGSILLETGLSNHPDNARIGETILRRIAADIAGR